MIEALEALADIDRSARDAGSSSNGVNYVRRAARALERRRLGRGMLAADIVCGVLLENGPGEPLAQTRALAELYWPLVLTTNYDDLYGAAVHQRALATRRYQRWRTGDEG